MMTLDYSNNNDNQGMHLLLTISDGEGLWAWLRVAVFLQENVEPR